MRDLHYTAYPLEQRPAAGRLRDHGIAFRLVHPIGRYPLRIVYFERWYHVRYSCHLGRVDLSVLENFENHGPSETHSGMGRAG